MKLYPAISVRSETAGLLAIKLSACAKAASVVSNDVAGGRSTITKKVPVSSLGTNPVGVSASEYKDDHAAMTVINVVTFVIDEETNPFFYLFNVTS